MRAKYFSKKNLGMTCLFAGAVVLALCHPVLAGNGKSAGRGHAGKEKIFPVLVDPLPEETRDSDRDGFPDAVEELLETDPHDALSRPTLADNHEKLFTYWPLMSDTVEAFGSGLDGDLRHGSKFTDSALKLDGKDDYVNFGHEPELSPAGSLSYSLWFQSQGSSGLTRLLGKFSSRVNRQEFAAFFLANRLWLVFCDDGAGRSGHVLAAMTPAPVVKKGTWQHLAVTWDAEAGPEGLAVYVNGIAVPLWKVLAPDMHSLHAGTADFTLGTFDVMTAGKGRAQKEVVLNSFKGSLAQLILCKAPLTALEAAELYALGRNGDLLTYVSTDFDQDGLPDWWERKYFGNVAASPDGDEDGDGVSNRDEFLADTDPAKPDEGEPPGGDSDSDGLPDSWEIAYGFNPSDPSDASADSDTDGLTNLQEYRRETHPRQPDTDADGLPDGWEVSFGLDPISSSDAARDADGDGWTNFQEYRRGGNPAETWISDMNSVLKLQITIPMRLRR